MVSGSLSLPSQGSFHLSFTVLYAIGHWLVFSLGEWSPRLPAGFLVSRSTPDTTRCNSDFEYKAFTFFGQAFLPVLLSFCSLIVVHYPEMHASRFRLFPFRSPLLRKSMFLSLPPGTSRFQFPGFPCISYVFTYTYPRFSWMGFPIRISADRRIFASPRRFSQLITSFFGFQCQGIHHALFFA